MFLIYDTETTGLPRNWNAPLTDSDNWPRLVQLAWQLHDVDGKLISRGNRIVRPDGFTIPYNAAKIHGITTDRALEDGIPLSTTIDEFLSDVKKANYIIGHNIEFDNNIVGAELHRLELDLDQLLSIETIDTKTTSVEFCQIPGGKGGKFKWPTLTELHTKLFGVGFGDAHDAAFDVDATARCFFGLLSNNVIKPKEVTDAKMVVYEAPVLEEANFVKQKAKTSTQTQKIAKPSVDIDTSKFTHIHTHSQFSILQSTSSISNLVAKAKKLGLKSLVLSDHGNMMGAFWFVRECLKEDIVPIVGIEVNICKDHLDKSHKDDGFQTVLIAKNKNGYHNLAKLSSKAFTDGFYYVPRIDKNLLLEYKDDLIVTTGGIWGEIPSTILNIGESQAEEAFKWYKDNFGDDFYVELNRHGIEEENVVNELLIKWSEKYDVKPVAANSNYYLDKDGANAHDILLCVKDAENLSKPKKYIGKKGREFRFGLPNEEFYFKSPEEMVQLFSDIPEAITNIGGLVDKCEGYELARDVLLPAYDIPEQFIDEEDEKDGGKRGENGFLRHLTYEGAKERYGEITPEISERLDFELATIERTGYPGYFLIVQDFTRKAREMGVSVGPGRGSAAGSAVAYCTGITNVDPIAYDLLFERFLNPDRVSMPDIDIDFDDEGRQKVIDYVIEKYGANQVAQIITYGTMAAKSSIRDTARVMELPLGDADRIAKLVPDIKLKKLFALDPSDYNKKFNNAEDVTKAKELVSIAGQSDLEGRTVSTARVLEGSVRNTGIHACGVIITPDDITNFVPVATAKDSDMWCTQFDNSVAEDAGLLKMDFLGLKTLTLIKDAVKNVKEGKGIDLDPESFPLDDVPTYELFQRGETVGIFQYESAGMQKYLKDLKPDKFADLIAMNALYRPGPLEYIPSFVKRRHGLEEIVYDLDACEEYLAETYGITVYQEQVMLLSQKLAGFTKGEADTLRKAMGKKKIDLLAKMKPQFLDQGVERGHDKQKLEKIWKDWEAFASYAFNKSHSTCYAWIAYQTAYLKANYPEEYMASVLSNNMNDIKSVTFFMEECRRMGIPVLGPDVNESAYKFRVNDSGAIRFGLGAMKGVGEGAVNSIVESRQEEKYNSIFDFSRKVNLKDCNKRVFESLAIGGAFDEFQLNRSQFFTEDEKNRTVLEKAIRYGAAFQDGENSAQVSMFGGEDSEDIPEPIIPDAPEWDVLDKLNREKEVVGIYISGHPLDDYRVEMKYLCDPRGLLSLQEMEKHKGKDMNFGGMVTEVAHRMTKTGKPFGQFTIEDYDHSERFFVFGDDYLKFKAYLETGWFLYLKGKVQERRFTKNGELEFKITEMDLLSEIREKKAKRISLEIPLNEVQPVLIDALSTVVKKHPGKHGLSLAVRDGSSRIKMPSRNTKVDISTALLDDLAEINLLEFKIEK